MLLESASIIKASNGFPWNGVPTVAGASRTFGSPWLDVSFRVLVANIRHSPFFDVKVYRVVTGISDAITSVSR